MRGRRMREPPYPGRELPGSGLTWSPRRQTWAFSSMTPCVGDESVGRIVSVGACAAAVMMASADSPALSPALPAPWCVCRNAGFRLRLRRHGHVHAHEARRGAGRMELEVRHLRALCAIADTGSLHRAARQLGVAQPSLSTQLRRIEQELGGELFTRTRTGCRPTPLGRVVLSRARPLVAEMRSLVTEARAAATEGPQLRIGSTASRALSGWLRRLRQRQQEPALRMDVSANALLRMVADGRLDVAFVHEVEGCPLSIPDGLRLRVLVDREPQFVSLPADHPAAARPVVHLSELADDRWMADETVDGEFDAVLRMLHTAGLNPRVLHGDYHTTAALVATGEVVTVCQATCLPRPEMAVRRLHGDPLGVRLLLAARTETELDGVHPALAEAYEEVARQAPAYREWLAQRDTKTPVPALP
ncbi:transcriptional regulator, LysR family [Streptomyces turgidiscabies Car8]|uniref:Transcriptional regulator, LysR family n=2 Tax=Streptomyces TaxID=1883 RepID=L7FIV3_STRT8|nr:transcriptional regulator, LysR family [Streptomyces turgidiscabies Car8]